MNFKYWVTAAVVMGLFGYVPAHGQDSKTQEKPAAKQEANTEKATDETAPAPISVNVADDTIHFQASGTWKAVKPRSRMLDAELQIPRVGDDEKDGRLTIMGAGGSIDANVVRWQGQFQQPDGSSTADKTKQEKVTIAGQTVHMIDMTGTFMDSVGGPFSGQPKVERENYRMLASIIEFSDGRKYFVKFYGPKATIDKNADHFKSMIKSLKVTNAVD